MKKYKKADLEKEIAQMEQVYNGENTPANIKDAIEEPLRKAKALLKQLNDKPAEKPETSKSQKGPGKEKSSSSVRKAKKITEELEEAHSDSLQEIVKKSKELSKMYSGTSPSSLQRDSQRKGLPPGKRTSSTGSVYYEYRGNRSDISRRSPYLRSGGVMMAKGGKKLQAITEPPKKVQYTTRHKRQGGQAASIFDKATEYKTIDGHSVLGFESNWHKSNWDKIKGYFGDPVIYFVDYDKKMTHVFTIYIGYLHDGQISKYRPAGEEILIGNEEMALLYAKRISEDENFLNYAEGGNIPDFNEGFDDDENEEFDDEIDNDKPDYENDAFIQAQSGPGYNVSFAGKYLGRPLSMEKALELLQTEQDKGNWKPTWWYVSDHGDVWPIDHDGNEIKMEKGGIFIKSTESPDHLNDGFIEHTGYVVPYMVELNGSNVGSFFTVGEAINSLKQKELSGSEPRTWWYHTKSGSYKKINKEMYLPSLGNQQQIIFYEFRPKNFTPQANEAFQKAIIHLRDEVDNNSEYFKDASQSLRYLMERVDKLLKEQDPTKAHKLLQEVGIYNYKTGMLVDTSFLNGYLAEKKLVWGGPLGEIDEPATRVFLYLFHGRKDPKEDMEDWGSNGPIIGPVELHWTYGTFKLFGEDGDFDELIQIEDMIFFNGVYYGDFSVYTPAQAQEVIKSGELELLNYDQFCEMNKKHKKGGRLKSGLMRDRKYRSNEPHELSYRRKSGPTNPRYKLAKGGKADKRYAGTKVLIGIYRKKYVVVSADGSNQGHLWANEYWKDKKGAADFIKENGFDLVSDDILELNKWKTKVKGVPCFDIPGTERYNVKNPDGWLINSDENYSSIEEAKTARAEFIKEYEKQGYYTTRHGRINYSDLINHCPIVDAYDTNRVINEKDDIGKEGKVSKKRKNKKAASKIAKNIGK